MLEHPAEQEYWLIRNRDENNRKIFGFEPIPNQLYEKLTPIQNGYGYYGVILYDPSTDKVQCHICGEWKVQLGLHSRYAHGVPADEYKQEFELGNRGLCSVGYAKRFQEHGREGAADGHLDGYRASIEQARAGALSLAGSLRHASNAQSQEVREKVSESQKKSYQNPERHRKQAKHLRQVKLSNEELSRINKERLKHGMKPEARQKLSATKWAMSQHHRDAILSFVYSHPGCSGLDITAELEYNEGRRCHYLKQLKDAGLIYSVGHSANTRYYPSQEHA